jgi:hypothetical protein
MRMSVLQEHPSRSARVNVLFFVAALILSLH